MGKPGEVWLEYVIERARLPNERLITVRMSGPADGPSSSSLMEHIREVSASAPGLRVLLDESELAAGTLGANEVRSLASRWRDTGGLHGARVAVVAPAPAIYGLNRMFQFLAGADADSGVAVFRNAADAYAWLTA